MSSLSRPMMNAKTLFLCTAVAAMVGVTASAQVSEDDAPSALELLLGDAFQQPEFLEVDDAFSLSVAPLDATRLSAIFTIADGYYLYRDKIKFRDDDEQIVAASLPQGVMKIDPYFGEMMVYKKSFAAPLSLSRDDDENTFRLHATYQGCAEDGICYSPVTKIFDLSLPKFIGDASANDGAYPITVGGGAFTLLLGAFVAGLLLTFTPCVLPMLPILGGILAGGGDGNGIAGADSNGDDGNAIPSTGDNGDGNRKRTVTKTRGGILALTYVLGTVLSYAAIGALAGATGEQLQAYFQNAWALGILAAVLLAMALSLLGVFSVQMPSVVQSAWAKIQPRAGGSLPIVFVMGMASALVVGACVSPILISFLGLAISTGDALLGAQMMTAMALGMGVPLIALGVGAGYLLPKAGRWMQAVNHLLGVSLIGVAIYLLGALPVVPVLALWGALLLGVGWYLYDGFGARKLVRGVGIIMLMWGGIALIGGFAGERNILNPLPAGLFSADTRSAKTDFTRVANLAELQQHFARAEAENKFVLLDYYADWCIDCTRMEHTTFRDQRVVETLAEKFVVLQVDVTDPRDENGKALKKKFNVFGPPAVLFFDKNGAPIADKNFYGYRNGDEFFALINNL